MGNCQAIDNATITIQHPNGKTDSLYCPVSAKEIMRTSPGHYVALLLTTTLYSSASAAGSAGGPNSSKKVPLRITRIKLLRPTDTLVPGHVYRLITSQEVMEGLWAKKEQQKKSEKNGQMREKERSDFEAEVGKTDVKKTSQVKQERHRSRKNTAVNSGASKPKAWQPALKSISEAGG